LLDPTRAAPYQHEESHGELVYACYEATLSAGLALVMNEDIFKAYVELRNNAAKEMVKNAATAAICLTNIGSAFALSTSYSVLPLAEWSLGQAATWLFLGEVPVIATTTVLINPVIAGIALIGTGIAGVYAYKSRKEKKKFEKRVKYHKDSMYPSIKSVLLYQSLTLSLFSGSSYFEGLGLSRGNWHFSAMDLLYRLKKSHRRRIRE